VALRNQLVHFKPSPIVPLAPGAAVTTEEVNRKYLKRLESKNILAPATYQGSWVYHATTKAVAEWSCKTASAMVTDFASKVPDSMWGTTVKGIAGSFKMS
jgi:ligand-binding sensor domain-containing protein